MSYHKQQRSHAQLLEAKQFYASKLALNPTMSRYLHFMAAICTELGQIEEADHYYRQTILNDPNNIMVRNDFAVHLANQNRKSDALQELKKATIITENNAMLQKNIAAIQGNSGLFKESLHSANKAYFLNPNDEKNHRNLGKIHAVLGDSRSSLQHNLCAINLEHKKMLNYQKTNTSVLRTAAIQSISKGGRRDDTLMLIDAARTLEKKTYELPTSVRTMEIINNIKKRKGDKMAQIEKEKREQEAKQKQEMEEIQKLVAHGKS